MRGFISEARSEAQQHLAFARTATTVQDLRIDADRYREAMTPMMADMDAMMNGMGAHCGGMGDMRDMHVVLDAELAKHMATMHAATQLPSARAEVERYASMTMSTMDRMEGMMGPMSCW